MNRFIEKIFGIDKIKAKTEEAVKQAEASMKVAKEAAEAAERATEAEAQAKLTPKERATARGEPWVAVLDTHVTKIMLKMAFLNLTGMTIL